MESTSPYKNLSTPVPTIIVKGTYSIVVMAIANANYEFIMFDIGTNSRVSDGGVIKNTTFWNLF